MNTRYKVLRLICYFISVIWVVYLFILQMFDPFNLTEARQKRYDPHKEIIIADRGNIYDSKGELLVGSLKYYQIDIDLTRIRTIAQRNNLSENHYFNIIAGIISSNSNLTYDFVYNRLINARGNTVVISENIDENQLLKIREGMNENRLNAMVATFSSIRRIHTKGNLAARLIGITNGVTDNSTRFNRNTFRLEGLNGIERAFNDDLLGDYGWRKTFYDGWQRIISVPNFESKPVNHGSSVYLTIDADIQEILENNLRRGMNQYNSRNSMGIIMNPKNGNILAMAGLSQSDRLYSDNQIRSFQNMPISFLFEPGSTMKPFVSLMAIERNLVDEDEIFDCRPYTLQFNRTSRTIRDSSILGRINFRDIIVHSSNVGISKIAERIGAENLYRGYLNFGFGSSTNIDLNDESSGVFAKLSDWTHFSLHSLSFGQEMSVTALQLATAYSALANGGEILRPNIVDKKVNSDGVTYFRSTKRRIRTVSNKEAINLNNNFLFDVVERGTATSTKFQNIKIAGKSGTSEKAVGGRYSEDLYTASFVGFFPYDNPEYVIVIVYDEPDFAFRFGSRSAVPTFRNIVEEMLILPNCNIIPEIKMASQEFIPMPNLIGKRTDEAKTILNNLGIQFRAYNESNDSFVVQQLPLPGVQFGSRNTISIFCNSTPEITRNNNINVEETTMPNLVGLSIRQAINISKLAKINLSIEGSGHVVSQSIRAGERIRLQQNCLVVAR